MSLPKLVTALPGPNAQAIIARDAKAVSPSYTRGYPLVMARGEGAIVEDVDGNRFLDCAAGIAVNSTGHAHPEVVAAIVEQSHKFLHMSGTDFYYEPQVRLAEEVGRIVPIDGGVKSFFSNSGTEANEAAIKLARYHTRRPFLIAFLGSFHGRTLGSLGLTSSRAVQRKGFGPVTTPGVFHAPYPDVYRAAAGVSPAQVAAESIAWIEDRLFVNLVSPDEVAGIVVEPIQGEGGYIVPLIEFHQRLASWRRSTASCSSSTKCSRAWGGPGRCSPRALRPEAGHPVDRQGHRLGPAARRHRGEGRRHGLDPGAHASTFGGNPVACAAASATIRLLEGGLIANAATVGEHLLGRLRELMGSIA